MATIATSTGAVHSVGAREHRQAREKSADVDEALRAEQDPAEDDEVERDEPAQPAGQLQAPADRVLGDEPEPVEGAPQHERPRGAVPEARRGPS